MVERIPNRLTPRLYRSSTDSSALVSGSQMTVRVLLAAVLVTSLATALPAQRLVLEERLQTTGEVVSQKPGLLLIKDENGKTLELKYQGPNDKAVSLSGAVAIIPFPARISVQGSLETGALTKGQFIRFETMLRRGGRFEEDAVVSQVELLTDPGEVRLSASGEPNEQGFATCEVLGQVLSVRDNRIALQVDRSPYARGSRLAVPIDDSTVVTFQSDDLSQVKAGDKISSVDYARFSTGDLVISAIEVQQGIASEVTAAIDPLEIKFAEFSDEPAQPRVVRSATFILQTDLSDRQAQILLTKLEVMIELVSRYFGQAPKKQIECFVVRDLSQWDASALDPAGIAKISSGEGVTLTRRLGKNVRSIVYSCDKHGVVQHEAMHAYCAETFGSTGPTWYAEGVAEMGQYWKAGERAVNIDPVVADYLSRSEPKKKMLDIVAAGQVTGDSWQAYAWRWALCHLLANNPNYSGQFKRLGIAMMSQQQESFETAYGVVAKEISFEYDQFVKHVANGYRADLCAWQWDARFTPLRGARKTKFKVIGPYGWQASGVEVEQGTTYRVVSEGTIRLTEQGDELSADGNAQGKGRLIGVIFKDFELGEPFELGSDMTFTAPQNGLLFLRAQEAFTDLADNSGEWEITLSRE